MTKKTADTHANKATPEADQAAVQEPAAETGPAEGTEDLAARLAEAQARAEENWNQYLRAVAEQENLRKRAQRDIENTRKYALERFGGELLPVRDSLELGLAAAQEAGEADTIAKLLEGKAMTLKLLISVMEKFGIAELNPQGEPFNPDLHEAMATQPSAQAKPNTVLHVIQKGYTLNGRLLRPARVLVAREPDKTEEPDGPDTPENGDSA